MFVCNPSASRWKQALPKYKVTLTDPVSQDELEIYKNLSQTNKNSETKYDSMTFLTIMLSFVSQHRVSTIV